MTSALERRHPTIPADTLGEHRGRHVGTARSCSRTRGSNASTADPAGFRTYVGGGSAASADLTVVREMPNVLAIILIENPSALCKRRISAQSSTDNTPRPPASRRRVRVSEGSDFNRRQWSSFQPSST
jgi:hypothetical protein